MPRCSGLCEDIRAEDTEAQAALGVLGLPIDFDEALLVAQRLYHQCLHGRFLQAGEDHLMKRCSPHKSFVSLRPGDPLSWKL